MSTYIEKMFVESYRGIENLKLENLGHINIIVGDNNCGKTSLLEAIRIVCGPHDIGNIAYVARQREAIAPSLFRATSFGSLISSLVKRHEEYHLHIEATVNQSQFLLDLCAHIESSMINISESQILSRFAKGRAVEEEVDVLVGKIKSVMPNEQLSLFEKPGTEFAFHKYSKLSRPRNNPFPVTYLSPIDHIAMNAAPAIRNKEIHDNTIEILKLFDHHIVDLRTDIDDDTHRRTWIIEHKKRGFLPLASYGDGTKKLVSFAGTIASMNGGVLLIDEFETSIHSKAMEPVFTFLIKACAQKGIQLFVTTHSIEALDKMVKCCHETLDALRIIMLEKNDNGSFAQIIDGERAQTLRFDNDAELR